MAESDTKKDQLNYRDAGVDIDAGNTLVDMIKPLVKTTMRPEVLTGLGGFGGLFQLDMSRYRQPVLVSGTDGVGTKLLLARQLDIHDSIGIDLVAMCVNDILTCGAEPLFFLDYFATGQLNPRQAKTVIGGIAEGCRQSGCALIGGETAEMPGMYEGQEYDLAGFSVGVVEREDLIDGSRISAGHHVLGLASSGPHSNGYSLIRKVLEVSAADHAGSFETPKGTPTSLGEALLAPTRIYVPLILELLKSCTVDGLAHITGGGLLENIPRVLPDNTQAVIDKQSWQLPAVFEWLQRSGNVESSEMHRTFNCGIGMVVIVAADVAEETVNAFNNAGETAWQLGHIEAATGEPTVTFK